MLKKSQAALEFLTTYAWAFLIILIMVGALTYFGVLSPSKLLPNRCNFGSEISCDKDRMVVKSNEGDTLTMGLTNNFGIAVVVTTATVTSDVSAITDCTEYLNEVNLEESDGVSWASDETLDFIADCDGGSDLVDKEKIKFDIKISYYPATADSTFEKTIFGEVFTIIQP